VTGVQTCALPIYCSIWGAIGHDKLTCARAKEGLGLRRVDKPEDACNLTRCGAQSETERRVEQLCSRFATHAFTAPSDGLEDLFGGALSDWPLLGKDIGSGNRKQLWPGTNECETPISKMLALNGEAGPQSGGQEFRGRRACDHRIDACSWTITGRTSPAFEPAQDGPTVILRAGAKCLAHEL
jgi:hypothetical protein